QEERWTKLLDDDQRKGFVLSRGPLMRLHLVRVASEAYRFCWSFSHLLLDGWSVPIVIREVFAYYQGYCRGEEVRLLAARPYSDYIGWLQRQSREAAEEHWRRYLEGLERATALQLEEGEGWRNEGLQAEEQMRLSAESTARLQQVARRNGLTMNTVLQAAWA